MGDFDPLKTLDVEPRRELVSNPGTISSDGLITILIEAEKPNSDAGTNHRVGRRTLANRLLDTICLSCLGHNLHAAAAPKYCSLRFRVHRTWP